MVLRMEFMRNLFVFALLVEELRIRQRCDAGNAGGRGLRRARLRGRRYRCFRAAGFLRRIDIGFHNASTWTGTRYSGKIDARLCRDLFREW